MVPLGENEGDWVRQYEFSVVWALRGEEGRGGGRKGRKEEGERGERMQRGGEDERM